MARNGSGSYILPAGNPVSDSTLISASWANLTLSDIGSALTQSLPRDGQAPMLGTLKIMDGAVSAPALSFNSETTTGLYRAAPNTVSVAVGGSEAVRLNNYGSIGLAGANFGTAGQYLTSNGPTSAPTWNTQADSPPPGAVIHFARDSAPTGWLKCNGAAVARTTYAALFAAIGTTWGAGDGVSTFNLPDLRGEFIRGWDDGRGVDSGRAFASFQDQGVVSHNHGINDPGHNHGFNDPGHWHSWSDPGHSHGVYDPGHVHSYVRRPNSHTVGEGGSYWAGISEGAENTSTGYTGISLYGAGTGMYGANGVGSTYSKGTGAWNSWAATGISTAVAGDTTRPRNKALLACIKY